MLNQLQSIGLNAFQLDIGQVLTLAFGTILLCALFGVVPPLLVVLSRRGRYKPHRRRTTHSSKAVARKHKTLSLFGYSFFGGVVMMIVGAIDGSGGLAMLGAMLVILGLIGSVTHH
jgi:hypothetical protein